MSRPTRSGKRTASDAVSTPPSTPKRARKTAVALPPTPETPGLQTIVPRTPSPAPPLVGTEAAEDDPMSVEVPLPFDFEEARRHLISVDSRFAHLFAKLKCKPFEDLQTLHVNPFRSLCSSILGQQISWLAARAITHKFLRIYDPSLPEKYDPSSPPTSFPTPAQVMATPVADLRAAGLSGRKVEYVQDLAARFADGRLDPVKLVAMTDDEVMEHLVAIRGIGPWSVHMQNIFTFKRPDVLPVGDLGTQKGLVRWWTQANPTIEAKKLKTDGRVAAPLSALATPPATPNGAAAQEEEQEPIFTLPAFPTSATLTPAKLKSRQTTKIKGNIYLSPKEMEELTDAWRPYRSIGVWYLWSLADGDTGL